jgi:hypothetical protein
MVQKPPSACGGEYSNISALPRTREELSIFLSSYSRFWPDLGSVKMRRNEGMWCKLNLNTENEDQR